MSKNYSDDVYYSHMRPKSGDSKGDDDVLIPTDKVSASRGDSVKYVLWELQTDVGNCPTLSHSRTVSGNPTVNVSGCGDSRFNGNYERHMRDGTVRFEKNGTAEDEPTVVIEPKANTPAELLKGKMCRLEEAIDAIKSKRDTLLEFKGGYDQHDPSARKAEDDSAEALAMHATELRAKEVERKQAEECLNWLKLAENFGYTPLHIAVTVAIKDLHDAEVSLAVRGTTLGFSCRSHSQLFGLTPPRRALRPLTDIWGMCRARFSFPCRLTAERPSTTFSRPRRR